jgi:hypothetical protein
MVKHCQLRLVSQKKSQQALTKRLEIQHQNKAAQGHRLNLIQIYKKSENIRTILNAILIKC